MTGATNINGTGNALANTLTGNASANKLDGQGGADTMTGGAGNDTYITDGRDTIRETAAGGLDTVQSSASLTLAANVENLRLTGTTALSGAGNGLDNRMDGNSGNNLLRGFAGDDSIYGGAGSDTLVGGSGKDLLSGGDDSARDVFVFNSYGEAGRGATRDTVSFFSHGIDDIDLRGIDANTRSAGDQAFAFGGTKATKNGIWLTDDGRDVIVSGDVNGDGRADFEIAVVRIDTLDKGDFFL